MTNLKSLCTAAGFSLVAAFAYGHHSTNGIYNEETEVELTGTVKEWRFINPHPTLKLMVKDASGVEAEWDVSYGGSAVTHLVRRGYTADTFKPGDEIVVKGFPALLEGAHGLLMEGNNPTKADGTPIIAAP
ncbi:MAG: hypothetical protein RLZZ227_1746 [Pseudomonadota bacterium]|jgi:hypothetical protein